ncbi:MAG: exo-beta-N-acetylmuramidase NamZ family protein [Thermoprotei archaeon]
MNSGRIHVGLEVLVEEGFVEDLRSKRIGIVTNHTGIHPEYGHIVDVFREEGLNVVALFAPEHGLQGNFPAGFGFTDYEYHGLTVYSLYGQRLRPPDNIMRKLDVIVFDMQDVGVRFYTYVSTLFYVIESVSHSNVELFVLDRPNPLNGLIIEGPLLKSNLRSFVGVWDIPLRYGMTIGELAKFFNSEVGFNANLHVIGMRGWRRNMWFDDTGLPWISPSPAIKSMNTAIVYPGSGLLEGTNVSEGRGTHKPFEIIGAPWINKNVLVDEISSFSFAGVDVEPIDFVPNDSSVKYAGEKCEGIFIRIIDREKFRPVEFGLGIIWIIKRLYPNQFIFKLSNDKYYFDLLIGDERIRSMIESNASFDNIIGILDENINSFKNIANKYKIYSN